MSIFRVACVAFALVALSTPDAVAQGPLSAQATPACHPKLTKAQCEQVQRAYRSRALERARDEAYFAYTSQRPWRTRVTVLPSLSVMGLGGHTKSMWGLSLGFGVQHEMRRSALRVDGLGRLGTGRIRHYDLSGDDTPDGSGGTYGLELYSAFVVRPQPFYVGPALATGVLFQKAQSFEYITPQSRELETIRIPGRAALLATGVTMGWELRPHGKSDLGFRCLIGAWDTFDRLYAQIGFQISAVLGD